jgi:hypothetical protein
MDDVQFANTKNSQSSAHEDPREVAECHSEHGFSVKVCCELLDKNLIGPYTAEGSFTAPYYKKFFDNKLLLHLEDIQMDSGPHPAFYPMGIGLLSQGGKATEA